ncbi:hypothetical protein NPIL_618601 [Nephila pilipes]|uniref:Uncharacterized protein n=1 Tax=Nephila pilipes TaxID=299642 RepID=A0A8X6KCU2_NEPPI|nr:hypothetical protein NPIL_512961 [Nephila pilipes]GFS63145.1 hypothetical protein NPIL_380851 [Nephila pilipes]GFT48722.1 hypothetical protein NPIL_392931 [Nephila pilipes]GFU51779.1 hypothetical protein NPIL_618601 [Nephila pilipes]
MPAKTYHVAFEVVSVWEFGDVSLDIERGSKRNRPSATSISNQCACFSRISKFEYLPGTYHVRLMLFPCSVLNYQTKHAINRNIKENRRQSFINNFTMKKKKVFIRLALFSSCNILVVTFAVIGPSGLRQSSTTTHYVAKCIESSESPIRGCVEIWRCATPDNDVVSRGRFTMTIRSY